MNMEKGMQHTDNDGSGTEALKRPRKPWLRILLLVVVLALLGQMAVWSFLPVGATMKVTTHDEEDEKENHLYRVISSWFTWFGVAYLGLGVITLVALIVYLFMRNWANVCLAAILIILCFLGLLFSFKVIFQLGDAFY